jgi:hypothetical protein
MLASMRGNIVDYLESKNKSPFMKKSRQILSPSDEKKVDAGVAAKRSTGVILNINIFFGLILPYIKKMKLREKKLQYLKFWYCFPHSYVSFYTKIKNI